MNHYVTTRPDKHHERLDCMRFADPLVGRELHVVIATTLAERYRPAADAYVAAQVANEAASTAVQLAAATVRAANAAFGEAFDRWTVAIDGANRKGFAAAALRPELGDKSLSAFLKEPPEVKVARMVTLNVHVDLVPALIGDPEHLAALRKATDALGVAVGAHDEALRSRKLASAALKAACKEFDRAYGHLVKEIRQYDPGGLALRVPAFLRPRRAKAATTGACAEPEDIGATPLRVAPDAEAA